MKRILLLLLGLSAGCVPMVSSSWGQTAALPGAGGGEASLSTGFAYASSTRTTTGSMPSTVTSQGTFLPAIEGNFQYGISENVGVTVHAGASGVQPGVKFALYHGGDLRLTAILPEIAFGYGSSTYTASGTVSANGNSSTFGLLIGARVLLLHASGLYAGLGYDFTYSSTSGMSSSGAGTMDLSSTTNAHNVLLGLGFDVTTGVLRIRPELAFVWAPGVSTTGNNASNGSAWAIVPSVSLGFASAGRSVPAGQEGSARP